MRNMKKNIKSANKRRMRPIAKMICLVLGIFVLGAGIYYINDDSAGATGGLHITYNDVDTDPSAIYDLREGSMQLGLRSDSGASYEGTTAYQVNWTVEQAPGDTSTPAVSVDRGSTQTIGVVTPNHPGTATVTVTVYDKTGGGLTEVGYQTIQIRVIFSVDTSGNDSKFRYIYEGDAERSLYMYTAETIDLKLNFGEATDAQWSSANDEVVTVGLRTGKVTAVGAGYTTITATYTPTASTETYEAVLKVYIVPRASETGAAGTFSSGKTIKLDTGDSFFTDTVFQNSPQIQRTKIYWVIKNELTNEELANSGGKTSSLIDVSPVSSRSNEMRVTGRAGEYRVEMYVYDPNHVATGIDKLNGTSYTPSIVHLVIKSAIKNKEVTLGIGDKLGLPESYNMTVDKFQELFEVSTAMEGGGSAGNYIDYNSTSYEITAKREGTVIATMKVKTGKGITVSDLVGAEVHDGDTFSTRITIVDGITLGDETVIISLNQEYQLHASVHGTYTGSINWASNNPTYVSVDQAGLIKGLKVTTQDVVITASIIIDGGITRTAECAVKVESAISNFTLNPGTDQRMNVGEYLTVVANIKETVSIAPLEWISSDESVFSVAPAADGKSALVTALAGGTATLIVRNTTNNARVNLKITVVVAIDQLQFNQEEYTYRLYQLGRNMKPELKYGPANATESELKWTISNTAVATVDDSGYISFKTPGTVVVRVTPVHNPNMLFATATINILGTPDNIEFENITDNTLNLEVSEEKTVNLKFTPESATTALIWKASRPGIVRLAYDEARRQLTVIGQGVGECIVSCRTEDNITYEFTAIVTQGAESISFEYDAIELILGSDNKTTFQLKPVLKPEGSTEIVTYTTRNASIASVNQATGLVQAVSIGTTQVVATTSKGRMAIVDVFVSQAVTGLTQAYTSGTVYVGESITIAPDYVPATATNKTINWTWMSLDNKGEVSLSGTTSVTVTGVKTGTVSVIGVSEDNKAAMVSYVLSVKTRKPVYKTVVTLSPKVKYLNVGKTYTVKAKVTGAYKGNKKLKWKSSNKKVASVTQKGKVKAKKVGKATITATAQDGSKKKGTMKIIVRRLVTKIKMNKSSASILVGGSVKLSVKVTPGNATVKGVTWKSGDKSIATVVGGKVIGQAPGLVFQKNG